MPGIEKAFLGDYIDFYRDSETYSSVTLMMVSCYSTGGES